MSRIALALLLTCVAAGSDVQPDPTTPAALDGRPVVAIIGQSNAIGVMPSLVPSIPPTAIVATNGALLSQHSARTGIQAGIVERLARWHDAPIVITEAEPSRGIDWVIGSVSLLASDAGYLGVAPDVVVVIHGERDSRTAREAYEYAGKLERLLGVLRAQWPGVLVYITEVRYNAGDDPLALVSGGERRRHLAVVRAAQHSVCARDLRCRLVQTDSYELADSAHYSSVGYYDLGWAIAGYGRLDGVW
jgi:hypothetical protein